MENGAEALIAVGKVIDDTFEQVGSGFWRVVTHEDGGMVSFAPLHTAGEPCRPAVIEFGRDESFLSVVGRMGESKSPILRRMFGGG